ncbi:Ig-like domain-containing protein [Gammaproteobacteria bacterium]|nr:Ig-like domain-containing protein [Gammaproteobacteria bacterium]
MKKLFKKYTSVKVLMPLLLLGLYSANADDFTWGEEFKEGDTISADVFNEIFKTIEKINRTVVDTDLIGSWNCDAITTRDTSGYTDKGSFYLLEDAQINFTSSGASSSLETPYKITTSSPGPLARENAAFTGTYQLYKNMLFVYRSTDSFPAPRIYSVDIVSDSRIELTFLETSATSFPASYSSFVVCDTVAKIPNPPTEMTISQNGSSVTIGWKDNSSDESGFKINRRTASEITYTLLTTIDSNISTYTDSDVVEGTAYFYAVSAINANGSSRFSNPVNIAVDSTAPTVSSIVPAANSTVGRDARSLTVNFSEPVKWDSSPFTISFTEAGSSNFDRILVKGCDNGGCDTDSGAIQSWTIALLNSPFVIAEGTKVYISVDSSKIKDANGVNMSSDYEASYNVDY